MRKKLSLIILLLMASLLQASVNNLIDEATKFYRMQDHLAFEKAKEHLLEVLKFYGRKNARGLTEGILDLALERKDFNTLNFLKEIDGENFRIYFALSKLYFSKGKIKEARANLKKAFDLFFSDRKNVESLIKAVGRVLFYSFWLLFLLFALISLSRDFPLFVHDLQELTKERSLIFVTLLAFSILAFPLIIQIGYGYLPFYVLAILAGYSEEGLRKKLGFLLLTVWILTAFLPFNFPQRQLSTVKFMEKIYYYDFDSSTLKKGEKLLKEKWDNDAAFYLARSFEKKTEFKKAIKYYSEILKKNPSHFRALNNLGILRLKAKEYNLALQAFERLFSSHRNEIIAFHNYSIVLSMVGRIDEAGNISKAGWRLFGKKWEKISSREDLIPSDLEYGDALAKYFGREEVTSYPHAPKPLPFNLLRKPRLINPFLIGLVLFFLISFLLLSVEIRIGEALYCKGCGKPICYRCSNYSFKGYCSDCMVGIELDVDSSSYIKLEKIKKKRKREFVRETLLTVLDTLLPGGRAAMDGKIFLSLISFIYIPFLLIAIISYRRQWPFYVYSFAAGGIIYILSFMINFILYGRKRHG